MTTTEVPDAPVGRPFNPITDSSQGGTGGGAVTPASQAAAVNKSADRGYVVLKAGDEDVNWTLVASIEASSAEQAIRRAIEKPGLSFLNTEGSTTLVAVPSRSWNPSTVAVKVETSIVFS